MNTRIMFGSMLMAAITALSVSTIAYGDGHEYGDEEWKLLSRTYDVAPVADRLYASECGSCHFAYQPGLLPERSWRKLMAGLENHFGENAELDDATREKLTDYLIGHAADVMPNRLSRRILASVQAGDAPLRISELQYIRREHDEIPARMMEKNPKVGSPSNCQSCHTHADAGIYNEHDVVIPGYGRFDD